MKNIFAFLLIACLTFSQLFANRPTPKAKPCKRDTIQSIQNGDWNTATTWSRNRTPIAGDTVIIVHQVDLNSTGNCHKLKYKIGGKLNMTVGSILNTGL